MKYFRMSYEEVVFKRSYINLILLNAAIPGYKPHDKEERDDKSVHFEMTDEEIEVNEHARNYFMNYM